MLEIMNEIIEKVKNNYNGNFDCEKQSCDMYIEMDGCDETIVSISLDTIHFEDSDLDVSIHKATFQLLAYINAVI